MIRRKIYFANSKRIILSLLLICNSLLGFSNIYNIKDFGAKGDGIHIDSNAINAEITEASKNRGGPFKQYKHLLSGSIHHKRGSYNNS